MLFFLRFTLLCDGRMCRDKRGILLRIKFKRSLYGYRSVSLEAFTGDCVGDAQYFDAFKTLTVNTALCLILFAENAQFLPH